MDTRIGSVDAAAEAKANGVVGCPPAAPCCSVGPAAPASVAATAEATLGRHLARRLVQVGAHDVFAVPGDFNLTLLDHLIAEPGLRLIGCCNELNAGYAADGYARSRGVGACVVTFTVGGLSVLNAIAGAYSENLPLICIVGGPNTNDYGTNRVLHHTIGLPDFSQELRCFQTVTCFQVWGKVTAQDVSTMLRCGQNTIIFLINNGGYTIEVEIHDGPYNVIKNWNYTGLVDAIHNGEGNCWTAKVTCEEELKEAIEAAMGAKKDCLCFIEVIVHKDDTSKELLEWGSRVSAANSRPPNPQ
ncbi:hypothetical protein BHE74_00048347 [Ensete ventricosum]|uniref:pyruvate decarboxylase n=1 Tax=Ensete ventricosum TaxID=4639 RepID=A0A426YVK9_ENSVE|nr:hypothetical protein B296_00048223 [Ensete ventricosum]RWW45785.1 hypothetical protein BHE74_00048347 [Ensete ventricosum]